MRKPAVFLAHGSPMSALGGDTYAAALRAFGDKHLDARGILIVSAHWQVSRPLRVTAWDNMPLLYDFGGFPDELYRIQYPSPGDSGPHSSVFVAPFVRRHDNAKRGQFERSHCTGREDISRYGLNLGHFSAPKRKLSPWSMVFYWYYIGGRFD